MKLCAWCGQVLDDGPGADGPVSHGICQACFDQLAPRRPLDLPGHLERMALPVVVLDPWARWPSPMAPPVA